jgi:integrase
MTFATRAQAARYLEQMRTDAERGAWIDPRAGEVALASYATDWLDNRPDLRPRTVELYEGLLRLHILSTLGEVELRDLTTAVVRKWFAALLKAPHPGTSTCHKSYRLLRTVMFAAVADGLIAKNPCVIKGAGIERPPERPVLSVDQVLALADAIVPEFRGLVMTATLAGLRLGEMQALRWEHVDLDRRTIRVQEQTVVLRSGRPLTGAPKTDAGVRTIAIPPLLVAELRRHRQRDPRVVDKSELVFARADGRTLRRATFYSAWRRAVAKIGVPDLHPHDLRHTGNTLAAATGASTRELMARLGHVSPRAALIYQHATQDRDEAIARGLNAFFEQGVADAAATEEAEDAEFAADASDRSDDEDEEVDDGTELAG